jgi:hypothetical protein
MPVGMCVCVYFYNYLFYIYIYIYIWAVRIYTEGSVTRERLRSKFV